MKGIIAILAFAFVLTGCSIPQKKYDLDLSVADSYNYDALPSNYRDVAIEFISSQLKDPYSAHYKMYKPVRAFNKLSNDYFYIVPVGVNAKNGYGAYTGYKMFYIGKFRGEFPQSRNIAVTFKNDIIIDKLEPELD
ncbi:hypothetical protein J3U21_01495 [Gilliamella sp. B2776]|uniref:hypothetical protein n=1 Tax=unclassified Gilliamella TaxID=2685620 RepID=UPI0022698B78|nr:MULTISPECIES: hypothetical protein [unclassified Gilliamella]MCX8649009.1 hypothetical protein [Gilliamella sp. B2779]MCX8653115.1 hypothetical protein [Gilliamella sp. B2737]MCX8655375.1 hypothetical protein [Gilliamella sp. B2894]MCX8690821.1 hypothetical protein [Gilliamella sp. B2776]MCX8693906.1 hypothetical protein [Gilliamella sp. B2881]